MLIIIEGVDGSGKTTLMTQLADIVRNTVSDIQPITCLHRSVPQTHVLIEYEEALRNYRPHSHETIICDRWHIGPDVYGPIKRGDTGLDRAIRWHINNFLDARGALLVYTSAPYLELISRLSERGEDYIDMNEVPRIVEAYKVAMHSNPLDLLVSDSGVHDVVAIVKKALFTEVRAMRSGSIASYVGPKTPDVLLVGDSVSEIAYQPFEGTEAYNIVERFCVLAKKPTGLMSAREDIATCITKLGKPTVYALDSFAEKECRLASVPYGTRKDLEEAYASNR